MDFITQRCSIGGPISTPNIMVVTVLRGLMRMKNKFLKFNIVNQLHFNFFKREKEKQDPYLHKPHSLCKRLAHKPTTTK